MRDTNMVKDNGTDAKQQMLGSPQSIRQACDVIINLHERLEIVGAAQKRPSRQLSLPLCKALAKTTPIRLKDSMAPQPTYE